MYLTKQRLSWKWFAQSPELHCAWYALKSHAKPISQRRAPRFGCRFWNETIEVWLYGKAALQPRWVRSLAGFFLITLSSTKWQETAGWNFWVPLMKRVLRSLDLLIKWNKTNIPWWFPESSLPRKTVESPHRSRVPWRAGEEIALGN